MKRPVIPINRTAPLESLLLRMTWPQRREIRAMLEHYTAEFQRIEREGEANPESIAFSVHALVDEQIAHLMATDPNAPKVTCRRGCGACCHLHVSIDRHEAALLVTHAITSGIEIDRAKLARQAGHKLRTWAELSDDDRRCVFLGDDDACRVYEHRPNACRKYQVITDPELCDTQKHPGQEVGMLVSGAAEVISSAALIAFADAGSMADMLTEAMAAPRAL